MAHVESRCLTHAVLYEDWPQIAEQLGLSVASHPRASGDGRRPRRIGHPLSKSTRELLSLVSDEAGFCVLRPRKPNVTELNKALAVAEFEGCLPDGSFAINKTSKKSHYIKMCPKALQVTADTIKKQAIHAWHSEEIKQLQESSSGSGNGAGSKLYVLVWTTNNPRQTKMSANVLESFLGTQVADAPTGKPCLVYIVSPAGAKILPRIKSRLSKAGTTSPQTISAGRGLPNFPERHRVQTSLATVIWVDAGITDCQIVSFTQDAPADKIFLLADKADRRSSQLIQELEALLKLARSHCHVIETDEGGAPTKGALDEVVAQVQLAIQNGEADSKHRDECRRTWQSIQGTAENIIGDPTLDPDIVGAVFEPFKRRVVELSERIISAGEDAQTQFVRVATPIYKKAKQILALNTDRYASFWRRREFDEQRRKEFLSNCETVRLSLYSSPYSLFGSINRLNYQVGHYNSQMNGDPNSVKLLVGDLHGYEQSYGALSEDVALIESQSGVWHRFRLSERTFSCEQLGDSDARADPTYRLLVDLAANSGQFRTCSAPGSDAKHPHFSYFLWIKDFQTAESGFVKATIRSVFSNSGSGAHRVLMFHNDGPIGTQIDPGLFRRIVLSVHLALKFRMADFGRVYGLRSIEYGSLIVQNGARGKGSSEGGVQLDRDESRHMLILHFDTDQQLLKFSLSNEIDLIRDNLYRDILKARQFDKPWETVSEAVKLIGNRYLTIHDYSDWHELDHCLKHLTERTWPDPFEDEPYRA